MGASWGLVLLGFCASLQGWWDSGSASSQDWLVDSSWATGVGPHGT